MTPILNVPFLPDEHYIACLEQCTADLESVHFCLEHEPCLDSRVRVGNAGALTGLARLPGVRKYALLNSRFHDPRLLVSGRGLQPLVRTLSGLLDRKLVDGIVYCDHYLLQRLADEELAQAEYDDWVRTKVAAARADNRPGMSTDQLRQTLQARAKELRNAL